MMTLQDSVGGAPDPLPWTTMDHGRSWRAECPDGRVARVERLADGASYLPWVGDRPGPVCATALVAMGWCGDYWAGEPW